MATAIFLKPSTRMCGRVPLGAPARLSCAAEGASSGLAGAVNSEVIKSKLYKIEASTVDLFNRSIDSARVNETRVCGVRGVNRGKGMA